MPAPPIELSPSASNSAGFAFSLERLAYISHTTDITKKNIESEHQNSMCLDQCITPLTEAGSARHTEDHSDIPKVVDD